MLSPLALAVQNAHVNATKMLLSLGANTFTLRGIRRDLLHTSATNNVHYDPYSPFWLALGLYHAVESDYNNQKKEVKLDDKP